MRRSMILALALTFLSLWLVMAAGMTAVWLTEEIRVFGLVVVPPVIVASLLVLYFDWRRELLRPMVAEHDDEEEDLKRAA